MQVVRDTGLLKSYLKEGSALTVGTFDGVHLGHKKLINFLVEESARRRLKSIVITFEPHPIYVLRPEIKVERIAMPDEKIERLSKFGLDYLTILDFNEQLANRTAMQFFTDIVRGDLNARFVALGYNHTFGKNREGNLDFLRNIAPSAGCEVSAVEPYVFENAPVSSSRIRKAVRDGEVEKANRMLTQDFSLPGVIVKGKGLGHKLGYPTINIKVDAGKLLPKPGVYASIASIADRDVPGMMYVHPVPEMCELEVNLFGFDGEVYDTHTKISPIKFTREAVKFPDYESLTGQLAKDEKEIKRYFGIN